MIEPAKIQVRFADLDILGHVNNTIYLSYMEMARIHYFNKLLGENWDWQSFGMIIVKNEVEYIKSIRLNDEPLIHVYTEAIGNKSFTLIYEFYVRESLYTKGRSVQACFDAKVGETIVIPEQLKSSLEKLKR
jgi:acyl-CoA thioester hydrolase